MVIRRIVCHPHSKGDRALKNPGHNRDKHLGGWNRYHRKKIPHPNLEIYSS